MSSLELDNNTNTHRYYKHRNKTLIRKRDDSNGNYELYKQQLSNNDKRKLKNIYGGNGDEVNISASFLLKFPTANYSDIMQNKLLKGQILTVFKTYSNTGVLSTYDLDTDESELNIYINVTWESSDVNAETQADALIAYIKNSTNLTNMFATVPIPFDNVQLNTTLNPITMEAFVIPTILSLVSTYNSPDTDVEVKTVGLYDHIGIKKNKEDDNEYIRLRTNGVKTHTLVGVNPEEDVVIATLFDKDYKKLYTSIQSPIIYIQQTQGQNGDAFNVAVNGSITLDLTVNDFITNNQADFITTMNLQTGGYTIVINVFLGSAIVDYKVIFDTSTTQQEINGIITLLSSDISVQALIDTSTTMIGVTSTKTAGVTIVQKNELTLRGAIINVKYDEANTKIVFEIIGSYNKIVYKAVGQSTYLTTTNKTVDPPVGFTTEIEVKLLNASDGDITPLITYYIDRIQPVITLIGDNPLNIKLGDEYIEQGATVVDDSGEVINAVITGTINVNTLGSYNITYSATDGTGNNNQIQRIVNVTETVISQYISLKASNVVTTDSGDSNLPTFTNGQLFSTLYDGWAPTQAALGDLNLANPWRVIVKYQFPTVGDKWMNINFNGNTVGQTVGLTYMILYDGSTIAVNGLAVNDNSAVPSSFYEDGNPHYIVITRLASTTKIEIYNNAFTVIWDTTITTNISYTNTYPVGFYCNAQLFNVLGIIAAQNNTITPQDLESNLALNSNISPQYVIVKNYLQTQPINGYNTILGYIDIAPTELLELGSYLNNDFTIEIVFKHTVSNNNNDVIIDFRPESNVSLRISGGNMAISSNMGDPQTFTNQSIVLNEWTHGVWMRENNIIYSYINGIKASTSVTILSQYISTLFNGNTKDFTFGGAYDFPPNDKTYGFTGYIAQLSIKNKAVYNSNFTSTMDLIDTINEDTKYYIQNNKEHMTNTDMTIVGDITTNQEIYVPP